MESTYNDALKRLRHTSDNLETPYSERLFDNTWFYFHQSNISESTPVKISSSNVKKVEAKSSVTERVKVLDELHQFGHEQFDKLNKDKIPVKGGGEILKKTPSIPTWEIESLTLDQLKASYFNLSTVLAKSKFESEHLHLDVLFIADDNLINTESELLEHKKLGVFYDQNVAVLFQRMIFAMKLDEKKYSISSICDDIEDSQNLVLSEIILRKPRYIVSLGGYITSHLLKTRDRLTQLRGRFHKLSVKSENVDETFELLPLFSPNYLNEAPNSKRLAWEDMQKLMEKLS